MAGRSPDYLNDAPLEEVNAYYREYVPDAFRYGVERFQEGQQFGLCPPEALETPPLAIIGMLTDVYETPERVVHSLCAAEYSARAAEAPVDLALWCNFEVPHYEDVVRDHLSQARTTTGWLQSQLLDKDFYENAGIAQAWENAVEEAHARHYSMYERLIDSILAAEIDSTFLRIRPVFTDEPFRTPLTKKRGHSDEGILDDAEWRGLSPDILRVIVDTDTPFFGKRTLGDIITYGQKGERPLVKARTVYVSEPNPIPLAQRKQSERLAAIFAKAQYLAEEDTFRNGGTLPYLAEVGTATSLRNIGRCLGFSTPRPQAIGESRAYLYNIQDALGIMPKDAVQFLPNSRVGTSNRRIVQKMEQWLAHPDRHGRSAMPQPNEQAFSHYQSAIEHEKNGRVLTDNLGADSNILAKFQAREASEPLTSEDILAIIGDAVASYRKKISEAQINRLLRLAGRLGLIEDPASQAA